MARFPKIQRMCPVRNSLAEFMDGDVCRLCNRKVFDLTAMSDAERVSFMESCTGDVCVSYKLPLRSLAAAAALSAATVAMPAAAQDIADVPVSVVEVDSSLIKIEELPHCADDLELIEYIVVGGIKDPTNVEYVDTEEDLEIPELPVVFEGA